MRATKAKYEEEELVRLLKQQDREAFEYLYKQYSSALMGILIRSVEDEEVANDLLQDVFVKIWKSIANYNPERGRLYTWMLNIARNTGIDYMRSKHAGQNSKNQNIEDLVYHVDNLKHVTQETDGIGLKTLMEKLAPEQQILIEYIYYKGYTHDDAAKTLDIPLGTVKSRVRNAIGILRKQFKE